MTKIEQMKEILNNSKNIVFLTGAGVSTLSGIPDFRSANGLYNNHKYTKRPEDILSGTFFFSHTKAFYDFYKENFDCRKYEPNIVHKKMVELEKNKNITIITQNVDGLHTKAGSTNVIEYHGSIYRNSCTNHCEKYEGKITADYVFDADGIPRCPKCNAIIKPDITLYEETPYRHMEAYDSVIGCDVLVVCGTSLNVYPAADFVNYLTSKQKLIIINKEATPFDDMADVYIYADLGEVFKQI